ncbi:MAG: hypothetical protein ACFFCD_17940 [Promethearchaeota archaeon]
MDERELINEICPPLDETLVRLLVAEFVAMERRYVLQDWEPAVLDGGQYCEITARILYHIDADNLNRRKNFNDCVKYVEDEANLNKHNFPKRRTALHLCKVLRTLYKFRSQRGAVHIDPDYTANEVDASMLMANVRWLMAEILRVFWTGNPKKVSAAIQEIVRYNVPAVLSFDDKQLVLRTDCTIEEEILILLHNAGSAGLTRTYIGKAIPKAASSISNALARLLGAGRREIVQLASERYILTPNGTRRVHEELGPKMTLS